jgi:hypothetical protein
MANKTAPCAEPLDVKEIVSSVDAASGLLAHAAESFADVVTIFKAISAAVASNSLAGRLSRLGESLCDERFGDFEQYRIDFNDLVCRFTAEMNSESVSSAGASAPTAGDAHD